MHQRLSKRIDTARQDGFTLIELLIVIVILGILAGIVVFAVGNARGDSVTSACKADKKTVATAAEAYKAKRGSYPTQSELTTGTDATLKSYPSSPDYTISYGVAAGVLTVGPATCP